MVLDKGGVEGVVGAGARKKERQDFISERLRCCGYKQETRPRTRTKTHHTPEARLNHTYFFFLWSDSGSLTSLSP